MTWKDYKPLIARLEREHTVAPERYRFKTIVLALIASAYPLGLVASLLAGVVVSLFGLLEAAPALVVSGLFVALVSAGLLSQLAKSPEFPQECRRLSGREVPKLYALIEKIRKKIKGPKISAVYLTDDFSLCIRQIPRRGILGGQRNVLQVGLPLLQLLSRKEFAALLAHEFEHISGHQDGLSAWIYRLRNNWSELLHHLPPGHLLHRIAWAPLRAFIPYFEAFSFVMARRSELQADRLGGAVVGKRLMADALISQELGRRFLDEQFWPNLWAQAAYSDHPTFAPHTLMRTAQSAGCTEAGNSAWLTMTLRMPSDFNSTTPCLSDRLLALDQRPELPPRATHSAAQTLMSESLPRLCKEFDERWLQENVQTWQSRRRSLMKAHEMVAQFGQRKLSDLHVQDQCHYGLALLELDRPREALPVLQQAADHPQGSAQAAMATARILHELGDEATIHYLELAMSKDANVIKEAANQAAEFYLARGDRERACDYWTRSPASQAA
ncbi:M48 family metalloprotease [Uliginosibacterium gangwonense]|uniref:M48 family metalloprotease n=1 Tax=Uliginosibacterium gangwonense TaxID=392736 RepID=UPI00036601D8|nr:M48 family metalloprotease [Uliginosibacterium gangwonense]